MKRSVNKFVIRRQPGSHGHTDYQLISTLEEFERMSKEIGSCVKQLTAKRASNPDFEIDENVVFNAYATLTPGRTSRNSISLLVVNNLEKYERATPWKAKIKEYVSIALIILILIFAVIGFVSVIRHLWI